MYSIDIKAYPSACDEHGKMKLYQVMQKMQDCSELWMQSEQTFANYMSENNMTQLLAYRQLDIIREPLYAEDLKVQTSIYEVSPMFGFRNTCIYDAQGQACYKSWSIGAFVNKGTGKLQKIPESVLQSVKLETPVDMEYTARRIIVPSEEFQTLPTIPIKRNDIDYNKHVNNAEYLRMALELLPKDFDIKRIRIEYKIPAKLEDSLTPQVLDADKTFYVKFLLNGHLSTVFEFSR